MSSSSGSEEEVIEEYSVAGMQSSKRAEQIVATEEKKRKPAPETHGSDLESLSREELLRLVQIYQSQGAAHDVSKEKAMPPTKEMHSSETELSAKKARLEATDEKPGAEVPYSAAYFDRLVRPAHSRPVYDKAKRKLVERLFMEEVRKQLSNEGAMA